jgi:hypothetical protein
MLLPMAIFRHKTELLEKLDPVDHLSFQVLETKKPDKGGEFSSQVEFLSINVFVEVLCIHNSQ